jgi:uncharacterized membrane protein
MGQLGEGVQALLLFAVVLGFLFVMVGVVWIGIRWGSTVSRRRQSKKHELPTHRRVADGEETQAP